MNELHRYLLAVSDVNDRARDLSAVLDQLRFEIQRVDDLGRDLGIRSDKRKAMLPKVRGAIIPPEDGGDEDAGEESAPQDSNLPRKWAEHTIADLTGGKRNTDSTTATADADHAQAIAEAAVDERDDRAGPPTTRGGAA